MRKHSILFPWDQIDIEGDKEELLKKLKDAANPNCNKCYGRGHLGYAGGEVTVKVEKNNSKSKNKKVRKCGRSYIPCKCTNGKLTIGAQNA